MSTCNGCGGVVGRDCYNPQECEWISRDQQARAMAREYAQPDDGRISALEAEVSELRAVIAAALPAAPAPTEQAGDLPLPEESEFLLFVRKTYGEQASNYLGATPDRDDDAVAKMRMGWMGRATLAARPAPTPAAAEGQAEPFAWIIARDSDDEWDGGEPMMDKDEADDYMENQCLPGWHLEALYRAAPLLRQAAVQEAPSKPVKPPMTYEQFMDEAERTGLTAGDLIPGVVVRLAEMEAQGVIRKHEDGGHEWVAAPGELGQ